jgi:GNAT superfamily N-acetyltransferase
VDCTLVPAGLSDAGLIAAIHTESWRDVYRPFLPQGFLVGPIEENRNRHWHAKMSAPDPHRRLVLKAVCRGDVAGFVCVLLDADPVWGPLLDNLHVRSAFKGLGIGWRMFRAAHEWVGATAPGQPMHLWVIEDNLAARRFYDRQGGTIVERRLVEVTAGACVPAMRYLWPPISAVPTPP